MAVSRRQLALEFKPTGWGGRRPGAGRKPGPKPRIRHRSRVPFASRFPCHVTLKTRPGVPSLRTVKLVRELEGSFAGACERGEFRLVHYSLQSDHVHLVVEAKDRFALGRGMKSIGARVARAVNRVFARRGPVLLDRYHFRVLRTPREVRNALAYVLLNARRHLAKRLGAQRMGQSACLDPASSGRWFDGWRHRSVGPPLLLAASASLERPPPVANPRTWLLDQGWRRHGRIDPAELPGTGRREGGPPIRSAAARVAPHPTR